MVYRRQFRCKGGSMPPGTVIIPARDNQSLLTGCLETVYREMFPGDKVIVIDDGSSTPLKDPFSRARIIRHETPEGPYASRNEGVRLSETPVVIFVDARTRVLAGCGERLTERWRMTRLLSPALRSEPGRGPPSLQ